MGHIDGRDAERLLDPPDALAERHADSRVKGRQGLVQEEHPRLDRQRPGESHSLLLATGQLVRIARS